VFLRSDLFAGSSLAYSDLLHFRFYYNRKFAGKYVLDGMCNIELRFHCFHETSNGLSDKRIFLSTF
jgi:hypothetical protein